MFYEQVSTKDDSVGLELSPPAAADGVNSYSIKILFKEQAKEVVIGKGESLHSLKAAVHRVTSVEVARQRLIFQGKILSPNESSIEALNIKNGSSIHLFPTQQQQPSPSVINGGSNEASSAVNTATFGHGRRPFSSSEALDMLMIAINDLRHEQQQGRANRSDSDPRRQQVILHDMLFDPEMDQTLRDIKAWSLLLIFLSSFSVFNNVTYFLSYGNFGNNLFDSIVVLMDTGISVGGLYVGRMGLTAARTLDLNDTSKYLRHLTLLAVFAILLRILWVVDVVQEAQKSVNDAAVGNASSSTDASSDSSTNDPQLTQDMMQSFELQISVIAIIIIGSWFSCVFRAARLHTGVMRYMAVPEALRSADSTSANAV